MLSLLEDSQKNPPPKKESQLPVQMFLKGKTKGNLAVAFITLGETYLNTKHRKTVLPEDPLTFNICTLSTKDLIPFFLKTSLPWFCLQTDTQRQIRSDVSEVFSKSFFVLCSECFTPSIALLRVNLTILQLQTSPSQRRRRAPRLETQLSSSGCVFI